MRGDLGGQPLDLPRGREGPVATSLLLLEGAPLFVKGREQSVDVGGAGLAAELQGGPETRDGRVRLVHLLLELGTYALGVRDAAGPAQPGDANGEGDRPDGHEKDGEQRDLRQEQGDGDDDSGDGDHGREQVRLPGPGGGRLRGGRGAGEQSAARRSGLQGGPQVVRVARPLLERRALGRQVGIGQVLGDPAFLVESIRQGTDPLQDTLPYCQRRSLGEFGLQLRGPSGQPLELAGQLDQTILAALELPAGGGLRLLRAVEHGA